MLSQSCAHIPYAPPTNNCHLPLRWSSTQTQNPAFFQHTGSSNSALTKTNGLSSLYLLSFLIYIKTKCCISYANYQSCHTLKYQPHYSLSDNMFQYTLIQTHSHIQTFTHTHAPSVKSERGHLHPSSTTDLQVKIPHLTTNMFATNTVMLSGYSQTT